MRVVLDLETNELTVPKNYFTEIEKLNDMVSKVGGEKMKPSDLIRKSFEIALADTDKYLKTRK